MFPLPSVASVRTVKRGVLHAVARSVAAFVCVAGVPLLILILVRAFYDAPISSYRPVINDEVTYWHQALTFSETGFHGGYYTIDEVTNPSGFTPFGPHGPGFAVLYGVFGRLFGWHRHSVVILNLLAISAAAWIWVTLSGLGLARLFLSGLMLVTFWPLVLWTPTGMQEPLHYAGAIVMASLFARVLRDAPGVGITATGWIVLAVLSFIRPSWIILLPLWALATSRTRRPSIVMLAAATSAIVAVAIIVAYQSTVAPDSTGFFFLKALRLSLGFQTVIDKAVSNIERMSMTDQYEAFELLHRYQYWVFLAGTILATGMAWRTRIAWRTGPAAHFLVVALAMTAALAAMFLLYEFTNFAEHRVLSASLLFGGMLCLTAPGRVGLVFVSMLILSNLAGTQMALRSFEARHRDHFMWDRRAVYALQDALEGRVVYQPGASRWCNTLLTAQYPPQLIAVPAGIGISVSRFTDRVVPPPRSHYLLLDEPGLAALKGPPHLEPLATLPYGTLYLNQDSGCEGRSADGKHDSRERITQSGQRDRQPE